MKPREGGAEDEDVGMKGKQKKGRDECVIQECVLEVLWYTGGEAVIKVGRADTGLGSGVVTAI